MTLDDVLGLLACPGCRAPLARTDEALDCTACSRVYAVRDGIPHLVAGADGHKQAQSAWFDERTEEEFEITRPFAAPAFYRLCLERKFRRATRALRPDLSPALVVCGGSGMDAHFLAAAGARVITSDLSEGAARRARERARRYGLEVVSIVADVERLPFADRSVPLVYVHDGLHHLDRPEAGLAEMARVASAAVSVTEPARARATALAVRVGLALEREEAGNRVARLTLDDVAGRLRAAGFRVVEARRYALLYRHEPGPVARALSSRLLLPVARAALDAADLALGRVGNKLTVQAVR